MTPIIGADWLRALVPVVLPGTHVENENCLDVTVGTIPAAGKSNGGVSYTDQARIPKRRWQAPDSELRGLIATPHFGTRPRCGLFVVDAAVFQELTCLLSQYPPERVDREGIPNRMFHRLIDSLHERFGATEKSIIHGATWDRPGLDTVTINPRIGRFLGLHLDSWDGVSFDDRDRSRTRLCVNIGPAPRSFIYVPVRLREAAAAVARARGESPMSVVSALLIRFLSTFPEIPIVRLNLLPGAGYFADTDNLIHDGSSLLATEPSLHFTMRGRFSRL